MAQTATREEDALDLGALIVLLSDAYTASYRGSSPKVRRRYRKLIVALTQVQVEADITAERGPSKEVHEVGGSD